MGTIIALILLLGILALGVMVFIMITPFVARLAFWWFDTVEEWLG